MNTEDHCSRLRPHNQPVWQKMNFENPAKSISPFDVTRCHPHAVQTHARDVRRDDAPCLQKFYTPTPWWVLLAQTPAVSACFRLTVRSYTLSFRSFGCFKLSGFSSEDHAGVAWQHLTTYNTGFSSTNTILRPMYCTRDLRLRHMQSAESVSCAVSGGLRRVRFSVPEVRASACGRPPIVHDHVLVGIG